MIPRAFNISCMIKRRYARMASKLTMEEYCKIWRNADAVCLDVDSTVIISEGLDDFAEFCGSGAEVARWTAKAMGESISFREALEMRLNMFKPNKNKLEEFIKIHPPVLTKNVKELTTLLESKCVPVFLISGGFHTIVDHVAEQLNIPLERVFANRLLHDENGDYAGFDTKEPTSESHGKARVVTHLKRTFDFKSTGHFIDKKGWENYCPWKNMPETYPLFRKLIPCYLSTTDDEFLVMIGDGMTDLEAYPPADLFIGFGGNKTRQNVLEKAPWFVYDFKELIDELKK